MQRLIISLFLLLFALSCSSDDSAEGLGAPHIERVDGNYQLKVGESRTFYPTVNNGEGAEWSWILGGKVVGQGRSYTFCEYMPGQYTLTLKVENQSGSDSVDYRIDVSVAQVPIVEIACDDGVLELLAGVEHTLTPQMVNCEEASFEWLLDGELISEESSCTVTFNELGDKQLRIIAGNEDGRCEELLTLRIVEHLTPQLCFSNPLALGEEQGVIRKYVSLGRELVLSPTTHNMVLKTYQWQVESGDIKVEEYFRFKPETEGLHKIQFTANCDDGSLITRTIEVECCAEEGSFRRPHTMESLMEWNKVYSYTPGAGRHINSEELGFSGEGSQAAALRYAEARLSEGKPLSLGGWGGEIVVGFDHSIKNSTGYDFGVVGDMRQSSSEPGIVWVMQDTNGNGQPDDEWYELAGSQAGEASTLKRYAITYYRPTDVRLGVRWRDNRGKEGIVPFVAESDHESYYPLWIESNSFTLYGTCLAPNTIYHPSSGEYLNENYEWGYADNEGSDVDAEGDAHLNRFRIADAVNADGTSANLQYIDFVKIQSGINHATPALGEVSTEVVGIKVFN